MPELTVRAFAELIHAPVYQQYRILAEQKYPKQIPAIFKVPYYRPALRCIMRYYQASNNPALLPTEAGTIPGVGYNQTRINNNFRVIEAFRNGSQASRALTIVGVETYEFNFANVTIRATADIAAEENGQGRLLLYNFRAADPDTEVIRTTAELFHYIMTQNGINVSLSSIEHVSFVSDTVITWPRPRQRTISRANTTAQAIQAIWPTI